MKHNTDRSFVGLEKLKQTHAAQVVEFEAWAARDDWERFHSSHYDWWTFPIDHSSAYGLKWTVYEGEIAELKRDSRFLERYLRGEELVAASWGWDLYQKTPIQNTKRGQSWHYWPVRLFKAALSAQLFGYEELFGSLKIYALDLMRQGEDMSYNGHDLSWLFTTGIDPQAKN
jgi:hypothetical protein